MRTAKYSDEQKIASQRYSSIKSRVDYNLEEFWTRADFINWYVEEKNECCYCGTTLEARIQVVSATGGLIPKNT